MIPIYELGKIKQPFFVTVSVIELVRLTVTAFSRFSRRLEPNAYETILSGDLADNDGPNWQNYGENSYHVVTVDGTDNSAVLDGFTITAGNSTIKEGPRTDALGGGLIARSGSPRIISCTINRNRCSPMESFGGGMYIGTGDPYVTHEGIPIIENCVFNGNFSGGGGEALFINAANPIVENSIFSGNQAGGDAGGIDSYGPIIVANCIITEQQIQQFKTRKNANFSQHKQ